MFTGKAKVHKWLDFIAELTIRINVCLFCRFSVDKIDSMLSFVDLFLTSPFCPGVKKVAVNPFFSITQQTNFLSWCQFYWHFTRAFFVQKCFMQLFSTYVLALAKVQKHFRMKNVRVNRWWNWPLVLILQNKF